MHNIVNYYLAKRYKIEASPCCGGGAYEGGFAAALYSKSIVFCLIPVKLIKYSDRSGFSLV